MAALPLVLTAVATGIQTLGQIQQGRAAAAQGKAAQQAYQYQAKAREAEAAAFEQRAGQERAVAQREAIEERKQGRRIASRARALGAASGALIDPNIIGSIDSEAEYRALSELASGENRARGFEYDAALSRYAASGDVYAGSVAAAQGKQARKSSYMNAAGTILSGGASFCDKYNQIYPTSSKPTTLYPWST